MLGVDAVPFVRSFSITLPVPLDEPEVDTVVKKLKDLRERILALGSIRDKLYKNKALVEKASGEAKSIADSAGGRLDALRNLSQQLGEISTLCNDAATIKGKIESAAVEAEGREKQIRTQLDRASELAASCKNKDEAQMLRNAYRNSLQALRDVGRGKSAAQLANEELKQKLKAIEDKKKSTEKAKQLADEISSDVIKVKTQVEQARQSGEAGDNLRGKLVKGIESLWAEIEALERGLTEEELTEEIKKQFQELRSLLASMNPGDFNFPALVAKADEQANRIADIDKQAQTTLSKYGDARCDVTSADNEVELIGNIGTGLTVEVTVASDLPQKAAACLAKLEGGEEPTPTPTDKEPKGKVPQSVADAQDVPEPIPTSTDTEPKGKVPSSIAQAQDVPEPTPTDEGEPKGNVPPSIAQAEPTTDPTSTSTDKEPKGKIPQSIAQAGDVPEPTPTLISSPPPAPEPPLTSEPTAEPTPTSIPILTPPNKPTEGEGKRVPNEIPGGGIPGDSEYIGEFTGTVVITDMTLDGEPTDLVSKDPTPINVRISQSQGNWLVVLDASVSNETIFSDCRITTDGGSLHCEQTIQGFHTILTLNVGGNELSGEATSQGTSEGVEIRSQALYKATRTK